MQGFVPGSKSSYFIFAEGRRFIMIRDLLRLLMFLGGCYLGTGLSEGVFNPLEWSAATTATWLAITVGAFFIDRWWERRHLKKKRSK